MKICLCYLGHPGYQQGIDQELNHVNQATVSQTVDRVVNSIVAQSNEWIKFPTANHELMEAKRIWQSMYKFPTAIGVSDCTHIGILKPNRDGDEYINRKGKRALNVQATCDAIEMFISVEYVCRVKLENVPKIIIACIVLDNVARSLGNPDFELVEQDPGEDEANHENDELPLRQLDIQEFYELTLLDENKSVQEKTAETIRIANKWEANDGPIIPAYTNNEMAINFNGLLAAKRNHIQGVQRRAIDY
ncbi:unnamed protein product [Acanthoscelides obtectus]|uniref:Nuclease HARBI1 n=1 Tax=Acanthoscelides obtectus TaxID=200917 RepID=A0A9P0K4T4_ACAOB|nr:unnamed protein product [Acanthoscelides obtectus]CAK1631603.1 Putative nuclease HARBI1 [Acanthoscelides obtectus]